MPIEFEQEKNFNNSFNKSDSSKMSDFLIKHHFVKDRKGANSLMLIITFIAIIITLFSLFSMPSERPVPNNLLEDSININQ